jgi:YVTN family beta-propeller protein
MRAAFSGIILLLCISNALSADSLLILSKGDRTLAIIDPSTLKVKGKAPVGPDPHEVIASSDGKYAYVSNYGGGAYHTLAVIDLANEKPLAAIDLGPLGGPHGLTFVGGKTWFTAEGAKVIGRYDPATNKVDWILGTGQDRTHMIWVSEDLSRIYTTNIQSATVSIISKVTRSAGSGRGPAREDWEQALVKVGRGSEGFDVRPDRKEVWVANAGDGTVSIIDVASKQVSDTLQANVPGANRLKFTPDGKLVFVSSLANAGVTVLDAATHHEVKRFRTPGAAGIQMQPDGSRVFVACTAGNYVAVIDPKRLEITGQIDAGPQPDGMAWAKGPE